MKAVLTRWEWSAETEAKRLIHTAHNIADGFFRVNNFFVTRHADGNQTIPRFWDRVKRADIKNFPLAPEGKLKISG